MFGLIFRILFTLFAFVGLAILFAYAFVAALIITPFLLLFFYFLNRHLNKQWQGILSEQQRHRGGNGGMGPIIDHDPNDLPR